MELEVLRYTNRISSEAHREVSWVPALVGQNSNDLANCWKGRLYSGYSLSWSLVEVGDSTVVEHAETYISAYQLGWVRETWVEVRLDCSPQCQLISTPFLPKAPQLPHAASPTGDQLLKHTSP